jgi:hypothetical protein
MPLYYPASPNWPFAIPVLSLSEFHQPLTGIPDLTVNSGQLCDSITRATLPFLFQQRVVKYNDSQ